MGVSSLKVSGGHDVCPVWSCSSDGGGNYKISLDAKRFTNGGNRLKGLEGATHALAQSSCVHLAALLYVHRIAS